MSTDVRVIGFDQNVPQWATEKTLDDVREILRKGYGLDKEQNAILESTFEEMQKTRTITDRYLSSINKALKGGAVDTGFTRAKKSEIKAVKEATDTTGNFNRSLVHTGTGLDQFIRHPVRLLGSKFTAIAGSWGVGAGVLGIFMKVVKDSIDTFVQTTASFKTFNEVGISYSGTFLDYQKQLAQSGIKVAEMGELVTKYSRTVGTIGLKAIHDFSSSVKQSGFEFEQYGLTQKEGIEYTTRYLDTMRLAGVFQIQDQKRHHLALQQNIKDLTAYSKLLNVSREDLLQAQQEFIGRDDINAILYSYDESQREAMHGTFMQTGAALKALGLDALTDTVAESIARGSLFFTESGKELLSIAGPFAHELEEIIQANRSGVALTGEEILQRLMPTAAMSKDLIQPFMTAGGETQRVAQIMGRAGMNLENAQANLTRIANENGGDFRAGAEAVDENVQAMARLRSSMDKFFAELDVTKVSLFMNALGTDASGAIGAVNDLSFAFDRLTNFLQTTIQEDLGGILQGFGNMVSGITGGNIWLNLAAAGGAVAVFGGALQAFTAWVIKAMGGGLAGFFGKSATGAGAGAGGALGVGKFLLKRIPLAMAAFGAVEGIQGFNADKNAGMLERLGNAGSSALSGATMGLLGSSAVEIGQRASTATPDTPSTRRIQQPEQISQSQIDEAINSAEGGDLAPLLQSIAMASNAQLEKVSELVRIVRSGQTGITGLQRAG